MAVATPRPQTIATWNTPTIAPVVTATQTAPQPKKTRRNVPKNSPMAHFGIGVAAISTSAVAWGGGSGRVARIGSSIGEFLYAAIRARRGIIAEPARCEDLVGQRCLAFRARAFY